MAARPWTQSSEQFLEHLRILGKVGGEVPAGSSIEAVVEGCKNHLQELFVTEERLARGQPLLRWYSSDCTPVRVSRSSTCQTASGSAKRRRKVAEEFLVQLLYQRRPTGHKFSDAILIGEPQQLDYGKTGAALYACAKKSYVYLVPRLRDHGGICLFFTSFDRACFGPLSKALAGQAQQEWNQGLASASHPLAALSDELLWCVAAPCSLHDCHNALKWGIGSVFGKAELWKELYVAVASCRSMVLSVAEVLSSWMNSVLSFADDDLLPDANELYDFYALLGASFDICQLLANTLRVVWDGSSLLLPVSSQVIPDLLEKISSAIIALLDFPSFFFI